LRIGGIKIHGVLEASLFRSFAVEIDYAQCLIRLHTDRDYLDTGSFSSHRVNISHGRPILNSEVYLGDKRYNIKLMIDTGFNSQLLMYNSSLFAEEELNTQKIGRGYCGSVQGTFGSVKGLRIVGRQITDVEALLPASHSYRAADNEITDRDGAIGNGLLRNFCVVFDYAGGKLYLKQPSQQEDHYLTTFLADEDR